MANILIVEDDRNSAEMLEALCTADGHSCSIASDLADARQQILVHGPDIMLLDLHLPDGSGLELFEDESIRRNTEIILITGNASVETSVKALRLGAADYLIKPVSAAKLSTVIARTLSSPGTDPAADAGDADNAEPAARKAGASGKPGGDEGFCGMRGSSSPMQAIQERIRKVARTSVSVFVVGESGTGKELVAQAVHAMSRRSRGPFKAVNCGAISEQLIESELFGHEKGSFTGAIKQHKGIFEQADGGTLFLDEITEMSAELQVRLLRVLETGTFNRVGSTSTLSSDVRVVAATNRDPMTAVEEGLLREDLYYRLNVFQIQVPALRERISDVREIADHFVAEHNRREKTNFRFTEQAYAALEAYDWPGNVRELRNVVHRAAILTEGDKITIIDLPEAANGHDDHEADERSDDETETDVATVSVPMQDERFERGEAVCILPITVGMTIAEAEKILILATLEQHDGAKEATAQTLGISMKTLYNRLRSYEEAKAETS
ncbi:MAG: sigma-54 dependent transcriptional regulator [Burkholderiaceae bacterium]